LDGRAGPALVVAGTGAALWAVRGERRSAYRFAKAAASLGFVTTALGAGALRQTWGSIALATGLATAIASGTPMLAAGAMLVAGSDAAVARHRFVQPAFANKLWGLPAYYLGQTLIALVTGR